MLMDFGRDVQENPNGQEMRRRRRQLTDDQNQPYVDLFSSKVGDKCSEYLARHPSPSDVLGRAFFGSKSFGGEKMILSTLNSYPSDAITLPNFKLNDQYLQWKVRMKTPIELICSYSVDVERLKFRGCTMLAYDPSLRKVYHGNCINVAEERIKGFFPELGIQLHVKYAKFLLDGMVAELDKIAADSMK